MSNIKFKYVSYPEGKRDKNYNLMFTEKEAVQMMDYMRNDPSAWTSYLDFNKEYLQIALNVLYNHKQGTQYTVGIRTQQYNKRIIIHCEPCDVESTACDPFKCHDDGHKHKKKVQEFVNIIDKNKKSSMKVEFKPLNLPKRLFECDSLEDRLDDCKQTVLGLQFVYKEDESKYSHTYLFTCLLCNQNKLSSDEMFRHLIDDADQHKRRYLFEKFGFGPMSNTEYLMRCHEVEHMEGKVNVKFINFTDQNRVYESMLKGEVDSNKPELSAPTREAPPPYLQTRGSISPPPPPLTLEKEVQTDADELDNNMSLVREILLIKQNNGEDKLLNDKESIELLLQSLQTLNLKQYDYHNKITKNSVSKASSSRLQQQLLHIHDALKNENFGED